MCDRRRERGPCSLRMADGWLTRVRIRRGRRSMSSRFQPPGRSISSQCPVRGNRIIRCGRRTARNCSTTQAPVDSSQCLLRPHQRSHSGTLPLFHGSFRARPRRRGGRSTCCPMVGSSRRSRRAVRRRVSSRFRRSVSCSIGSPSSLPATDSRRSVRKCIQIWDRRIGE